MTVASGHVDGGCRGGWLLEKDFFTGGIRAWPVGRSGPPSRLPIRAADAAKQCRPDRLPRTDPPAALGAFLARRRGIARPTPAFTGWHAICNSFLADQTARRAPPPFARSAMPPTIPMASLHGGSHGLRRPPERVVRRAAVRRQKL